MKDTTKKEVVGMTVAEIKGQAFKRYVTIEEDEFEWVGVRFWEERPELKHPLLLGMLQVFEGQIVYMNVKPSRRRRGYGTLLVEVAEKYCGKKLPPKDVLNSTEAQGFWKAQEKKS